MLVAHNPGMEEAVLRFSQQYESMPTAAVAIIELQLDCWSELTVKSSGNLIHCWRPKEIDWDSL